MAAHYSRRVGKHLISMGKRMLSRRQDRVVEYTNLGAQ